MAEKKEEEKSDFGEWCEMTGWHGILDFYIAKHWSWKIIWVLIVLVGCFFAVVQGGNMVVDFLGDDEWVTTISYQFPENGYLEWPNITVCGWSLPPLGKNRQSDSANGSLSDAADDDTTSSAAELTTEGTTTVAAGNDTTVAGADADTTAAEGDDTANEDMNGDGDDPAMISDDVPSPSATCPQVVVSCGTKDGRGKGYEEEGDKCCNGSLDDPITNMQCFKLKPNKLIKERSVGSVHRIYYLLEVDPDHYSGFADAGFEIRLYLGYTASDSVEEFSSFYVLPGTRNVISMISEVYRTSDRNTLMSFANVNLPCNKTGSYSYLTENSYTKDLCTTDCKIEWQMKYCGCYVDDYSSVGVKARLKKCNATPPAEEAYFECMESSNCTDEIVDEYFEQLATTESTNCSDLYYNFRLVAQSSDPNDQDIIQTRIYLSNLFNTSVVDEAIEAATCVDKCPNPCEFGRIEAKISSLLFVGPSRAANLQNDYTFFSGYSLEKIKKMTMLEMYYETKLQRVTEMKPRISADEFISNLGGCLGVWSGLSILSFFQIVFYLIRALIHWLEGEKPKRVVQVRPVYPRAAVMKEDLSYHIAY